MKIILIYDYLSEIGGLERVMATHARWLQKAGHTVTLLFNYINPETAKYTFLQGLKIKEISSFKKGPEPLKVFSALFGFNTLSNIEADLIIAYSFPSLYTARRMKCPKAFYYLPIEFIYFPVKKRWDWANNSLRKTAFFGSLFLGPILKILDKKWIKNKMVIANSEFTRREIKSRYKVESFISYPPLNDVFKPAKDYSDILKKFKINSEFIMTAGRIVPDKRTDWLIEVFGKLKNKNLDFVVAGSINTEFKKTLLDLAKKFKVQGRVKLIGLVDQKELVKIYSASKAFIFASQEEAFGLVPIEAMACGSPVIAWNDKAGPNEYVIPDINGYLAKPYDLNDFIEKTNKCLQSNFKKNNFKKIVESVKKFSESTQYSSFKKKIESLI